MAGRAISLMNVAIIVGLIFLMALRPSKPAPTARSAIGVAVCATLVTVFKTRGGSSIFSRENGTPAAIPRMMGLVRIFLQARLMVAARLE